MIELLTGVVSWASTVELIGVLLLLLVVIGENGGAIGLGGEVRSDSISSMPILLPIFMPEIYAALGVSKKVLQGILGLAIGVVVSVVTIGEEANVLSCLHNSFRAVREINKAFLIFV